MMELGLFIGIGIAVLIFVVQEIRGKRALKKLREDISKDQEKTMLARMETAWKAKLPDHPITPQVKEVFAGVVKSTAKEIATYYRPARFGGAAETILGNRE